MISKAVVSTPALWCEDNGVICFKVVSDGTTGQEWVRRFKKGGFVITSSAEDVLLSPQFIPSCDIESEIFLLKGELFTETRSRDKIFAVAKERGLVDPNVETACLIYNHCLNKNINDFIAMNLTHIVVMHKPVKDSTNESVNLNVYHNGTRFIFSTFCHSKSRVLPTGIGCAFVSGA